MVVDLQEKLLAKMRHRDLIVANAVRLVQAGKAIGMPVYCTEQYPQGLGATVEPLAELLPTRWSKTMFHAASVSPFLELLHGGRIAHITLTGIEAHVCVAQTALELLGLGYQVQIPVDAVASRAKLDWEVAMRRLERAGAVITTTEAVLFEWIESSDHPQFKVISNLVKTFAPPSANTSKP